MEENCFEKGLCFRNLTINIESLKPYTCNDTSSLYIPFHENRRWSNNPIIVVVTIYMYRSYSQYYSYINFVKSFALSNKGRILLLVSFQISLYNYLFNNINITKITNSKRIYKYVSNLDYGYTIFKYKIHQSYCYILYTDMKQKYFDKDFLNHRYTTIKNKNYSFSGYYAASTNLYSILPTTLKIFDYFDYFFKYDFDKSGRINIWDFAFKNNIMKKWFLFGTCFLLDSYYVCNDVKKMLLEYASLKSCNKNIVNLIEISDECINLPGWFTGMWLGFYTSPEIKDFGNYYISNINRIKHNRWGDQQFFTNALLLFASKEKLYYNLSYDCVI